ncbi:hypothetical protein KW516_19045 [Vibrio fluvialis]|nr:hypothetical protein [Vibrio fluvialis]
MATTTDVYQRLGEVINNWQGFVDQQRDWLGGPNATDDPNETNKGMRELTDSVGNSQLLETPAELVRKVNAAVSDVTNALPTAQQALDTANTASATATNAQNAADAVLSNVNDQLAAAQNSANEAENSNIASNAAKQASEAAQAESESARDTALTYKNAASASATAAASSESASNSAKTASQAAQLAAETAQAKSETAQTKSETAQAKSETAQAASEAAQLASESARDTALTYKNAAGASEINAANSASSAADSLATAQSVRDETITYKDAAAASANLAQSAKTASENAQSAAEAAATAAANSAAQADAIVGKAVILRGQWDASGGAFPAPTMDPETADYYRVSVAGTMTGSQGSMTVAVGDSLYWDVFNDVWFKIDNTDQVTSVAGRIGAVVLTSSDVGLGNVPNLSASDIYASTGNNLATRKAVYDAYTTLNNLIASVSDNTLSLTGGDITGAVSINDTTAAPLTLARTSSVGIKMIANTATRYLGVDVSGLLRFGTSETHANNDQVFTDSYHPNADVLTNARTLTIGNSGKSFNGSANVAWTLAEIGAVPAADIASGSTFANIVNKYLGKVNSAGVIEIARYIDFHTTGSTADYDARLDCSANGLLQLVGKFTASDVITAPSFVGEVQPASSTEFGGVKVEWDGTTLNIVTA